MKFKKFRFKKVKSTNNTAIRIIKNSNLKYGMVLSDAQTMGRGQYGKKWISYRGNLFVSFFYELENINLTIPRLTKINCLLIKKLFVFRLLLFLKVDKHHRYLLLLLLRLWY